MMVIQLLTDAIKDIWPMLTIFLVVIISIRLMYIHNSSEKFVFYKEFFNMLFIIYALILFQLLTNTEMNVSSGINIVPFTEILRYEVGSTQFYLNVIGNILVFLPFGYFVSSYIKATRVSHILLVTLITSFTIEFVQHYIGRSFDIDDILLNVVGAIIGFLLYIGFTAIKKHLPKFFRSDLFYNIICIILLVIAVIYYFQIMGISLS
ncbi:TPA: VanZ family protein [Candidatus Ventrenecus stercoripullorum]|nr:VanZ family protein [Candidatus Ventrenecus stercoripullorum]